MSGPEFRMTPHGGPFDITICDLSVCVCAFFSRGSKMTNSDLSE